MYNVLIVILGGAGTGLYPLARALDMPAAPLGGEDRLIDVPNEMVI